MTKAQIAGFSRERLARIMPFFQARYVDTGMIPGALALIYRKGEIAHLDFTGSIDLERARPMREDAIFRIYSMTKPITSVAVMMLMEEGRIALDDPVHKFIPAWEHLRVYAGGAFGDFVTTKAARPMRVIDLLRHTSGLTYGFMARTPVDAAYRAMEMRDALNTGGLDSMIERLGQLPLEFSPGDAWNYSMSTDVLGYLVQTISGMTFSEFLRSRILGPLGMDDTDFYVPDSKLQRFAACYTAVPGKGIELQDDPRKSPFAKPPNLESGGGGLVGTAKDYITFCRMMLGKGELNDVRLLSPKSVALMTMNHLPDNREMTQMMPSTEMFNETGYSGVGFGLGFAVNMDVAKTGVPGTVGEYSWGGAAATAFWIDPKEEMAVVFMTQVLGMDRTRLRRDFRTLVYSAMTESFA